VVGSQRTAISVFAGAHAATMCRDRHNQPMPVASQTSSMIRAYPASLTDRDLGGWRGKSKPTLGSDAAEVMQRKKKGLIEKPQRKEP
jgi:hypothetical protein